MLKTAKFTLSKNDNIELTKTLKIIDNNNEYSFKLDGFKMILNNRYFLRENEEYKLHLNIIDKTCILHLKEKNLQYDINVEKIEYNNNEGKTELIYKIETDDFENKITIEQGE